MPASVHIISDYTARVGSVFRLLCEENNGLGEGNARGLGFLALCEPQPVLCSLPCRRSAFQIIDDYILSISLPLKRNLCGLERCLPTSLRKEWFQQMSLWALQSQLSWRGLLCVPVPHSNNTFTLCRSKAWAPQVENLKTPIKQNLKKQIKKNPHHKS